MSASSWFVTWGMVVHEFIKYFDDNFLTLGISFISTSPNSEWEYSCFIFSLSLLLLLDKLFDCDATNNFTSLSITLPFLSLPVTWLISTPSSLANFRTFGLADEIPTTLFWFENVFFDSSFITCISLNSFSITGFSLFFFSVCVVLSKVNIESPS